MSGRDPIKVYDARWESGEFTDQEVQRLFEAALIYGKSLGVDTVTLSRDARLAAGRVLEIGLEAALGSGFEVYLCTDPISTPQSYFLALWASTRHPRTMGFTVTASHNPADYVGLKLTVPTVRAIGLDSGPLGGLSAIRALYHGGERLPAGLHGALHVVDLTREYVDFSFHNAGIEEGSLAGQRIILDSFNGSAGPELLQAMEKAGVQADALRLIPDGRFPSGSPNPVSQGKMAGAVRLADETQTVIGVDGDGDRLVFGDRRGILSAGLSAVSIIGSEPFAQDQSGPPAPVLFDPKVDPIALEAWGRFNVQPVLFRNGHSQIKDYMGRIGARFGAEESGHFYHRLRYHDLEMNAENSIVTVLHFLSTRVRSPSTLDELWELQNRVFTTGELNFQLSDEAVVLSARDRLVADFTREGAQVVTATPDGIELGGSQISRGVHLQAPRVRLDDGWYSGFVRTSTNEKAVLRLFFTAGSLEHGGRLTQEITRVMRDVFGGRQIE